MRHAAWWNVTSWRPGGGGRRAGVGQPGPGVVARARLLALWPLLPSAPRTPLRPPHARRPPCSHCRPSHSMYWLSGDGPSLGTPLSAGEETASHVVVVCGIVLSLANLGAIIRGENLTGGCFTSLPRPLSA